MGSGGYTYMKTLHVALVACLLALSGAFQAHSADLFEDFNDWPSQTSAGDVSQEGWFLDDGIVRNSTFGFSPPETVWIVNTVPQGFPDSSLRSPLMAHGVGKLVFDMASKEGTVTTVYIHSATNESGPWTLAGTFTNSAAGKVYTTWTNMVDLYEPGYIRFTKELTANTFSCIGIDNVYLYDPPAKIDFGTPYTEPGEPKVGQAAHVYCTIEPSSLATITGTKLIYEIGGTYVTNSMTNVSNDLYRTSTEIPAQGTAGVRVNYEVNVTFTGTNAVSPATKSSFYTVAADPFVTDYDPVEVIGEASATMTIVSNGLWRGIVSVGSPLTNAEFQFRGSHTNGVTTNVWGDAAPDSTTLVVHGTAGLSEAALSVDAMPVGDYAFMFNETTSNYTVNSADFNDFDNWTGAETEGNYESSGWVVNDGWILADALRKRGTRSCYLSADGGAYVRTPEQLNGVGHITFWLRHWETNAAPATECHVQVSETGGTNLTEWTTILTIPVISAEFNRFVIPRNDRYDRYVRILNATEDPRAKLAIDEFMVVGAGSGVTLSNLTHTPASPVYDESVSVSVDLETHRGATITGVTTYWRTGTAGGFTAQAMNQSGNTWTTVADIPAGKGDGADGLGAGTVEYYVRTTYSGYESSLGSPTTSPNNGSTTPASYIIQPAQLAYSNVVHTPLAPEVDTSFIVEADIYPTGGAVSPVAELFYRVGSSGAFSSLPMTNAGTHYVTQGSVPTPAHPGTPVQYYISTAFNGPSAASPADSPAGGASDPVTVVTQPATPDSDYTSMVVEGDFNGALRLHADHQWVGIVTLGSETDPAFHFKGTSAAATNTWGDNTPIANTFPLYGIAAIGAGDIALSGTYSNDFIFHFNASNGHYRANACRHEDYNAFTAPSNPEGWSVLAATVFETGESFEGRSIGLGGSVTDSMSYARSPAIDGGIGNVSFWYRNQDETGLIPGTLRVEVRENGGDWVAVDTITNILSPDYLFHETGYVSVLDNTDVQLLWSNNENPSDALLAVDHFTVDALGPYVVFSNLQHDPASPTVADQVTIDVDITPHNHATGLAARVWYRIGTNGTFTSTDMTETTPGHFQSDPPIPRGAAGTMQYYVEATFTDPLTNSLLSVYDPPAGEAAAVSYTNTDAFAAATYIEASEGWTADSIPQTNSAGWVINDIFMKSRTGGFTLVPAAVWLVNANELRTNSYIHTPLMPHGAGVIRFEANNKSVESVTFELQYSTNGVGNWQTFQTMTNLESGVWNWHTVELNIEQPLHLRIFKTEHTGNGQWLGLDNIEVSLPLARVAISNVAFSPLYPADSETVDISCEISSVSTNAPALDITARVYHKRSTEGSYTEPPIEMTRNGNQFVTASSIPAYDAGDIVDYYIESSFKGHQSIVTNTPAFSPAGAPDSAAHNYEVRAHESDYRVFQVVTPEGVTDMKQLSDGTWMGIAFFDNLATNPAISVDGLDFYNGTNVLPGISWGDSNQDRTNLPYSGQMQINGSGIMIGGEVIDQYVVIFDERTGDYTVRRAVYQDFNNWPASDTYFDLSSGGLRFDQFVTDFEDPTDWPLGTAFFTEEDFDALTDWDPEPNYPPQVAYSNLIIGANDGADFAVVKGLVVPQLTGIYPNAAVMLHDQAAADGAVRMNALYTEGAGTLDFDIRCVDDAMAASTYGGSGTFTNIRVEASIYASALPVNASRDTCGECYVSILGRYVNTNNYYELRMDQRRWINDGYYRRLEIWKCTGGTLQRLGGDGYLAGAWITGAKTISLLIYTSGSQVKLKAFDGTTQRISVTDTSPIIANGGIGIAGLDADIVVNQMRVYNAPDENYSSSSTLYLKDFSDGNDNGWDPGTAPWSVVDGTYRRPGYTGDPLEFTIDYTIGDPGLLSGWSTIATYTNLTSTPYISFSHEVNLPQNLFLRIRHTGGTGNLVVDNISLNDWHGDTVGGDWIATAAWVDENSYPVGETAVESNVVELINSRANPGEDQYLRTPWLTNGAYVLEFDYVSTTGTNDTLAFSIDYTLDGDTNSWVTDIAVTNNPAQWTHFAHTLSIYETPYPMYVRIANISSDDDAGMAIDNASITPPVPLANNLWRGYNVLVTGTETNRLLEEPLNLKGAYLNNSVSNDTLDEAVFDTDLPFMETAELVDGVGEVSFWYRAWDTNATRIDIVATTNRFLPDEEWTLLHAIGNITNQTFQKFSHGFYDTESRFVRLRCSTNPGVGRVCIDNVLVAAPMASGLRLRNVELIPEIPLVNDEVFIRAEVYDQFLNPSNISLRVVYRVGDHDWGAYSLPGVQTNIMLRLSPTNYVYQTTIPFVANGSSADTVIQYYIEAHFDGFLSESSSPIEHRAFTNPDYYWPVDLNSGQPNQTPHYITLSCLPGQVWINELNVTDDFAYPDPSPTQYIELCGVEGSDIGNWKVKTYAIDANASVSHDSTYTIPSSTSMPGETNGFGFHVLGKTAVTERDQTITGDLPMPGGIQLVRNSGIIEHSICYDAYTGDINLNVTNNPTYRFVYIGSDDDLEDTALYASGTGSNMADFAENFQFSPLNYSPGSINPGQTLIPWPGTNSPNPAYEGALGIESFWTTETTISMVVTAEATGLSMTPWYNTNLLTDTWTEGTNPGQTTSGTTYTVSCDLATGVPGAFYRVTTE